MATVKAFIRTQSKKDLVNVRFRLTDGRSVQLFHKSEIKVSPCDFNPKTEKIKSGILYDATKRKDFDKSVSDRKDLVLEIYLSRTDKDNFSSKWLDLAIDKKLHPVKYSIQKNQNQPDTVLKYIDFFISNADKRKDRKTSRLLSPNTKKQYITTQKHLISFAEYIGRNDFNFNEIDVNFYNLFVEYMTNKEFIQKERNGIEVNETRKYTLNTIGKYIRAFKVMMADAGRSDVDLSNFLVYSEDVDNVYLNEDELHKIKEYDFKSNQSLDRVRDWFLLLAWTGSRFGDLEKISQANINDGFITIRQQKTNNKVTIPLHPVVLEILQKYNYDLPKPICNQPLNRDIKEVCRIAGIDSLETITKTIGGKLTTEKLPKYMLVSTHTGRRSFATNMFKRGIQTLTIMGITGHKTEKSFLKYIKIRQEEHASIMLNRWKEIYK